jgi:hypothetical protein
MFLHTQTDDTVVKPDNSWELYVQLVLNKVKTERMEQFNI